MGSTSSPLSSPPITASVTWLSSNHGHLFPQKNKMFNIEGVNIRDACPHPTQKKASLAPPHGSCPTEVSCLSGTYFGISLKRLSQITSLVDLNVCKISENCFIFLFKTFGLNQYRMCKFPLEYKVINLHEFLWNPFPCPAWNVFSCFTLLTQLHLLSAYTYLLIAYT